MGALERQEDQSSAQANSGPISLCLCSLLFHPGMQSSKIIMTRCNQKTILTCLELLSRPVIFHNVIVVSHPSIGCRMGHVDLALLRFLC